MTGHFRTEETEKKYTTEFDSKYEFFDLLDTIAPIDEEAMNKARKHWNDIAKPIGSLGLLEDDIEKIAGIRHDAENVSVSNSALVVMCADHGVVSEGVSQTGQDVTWTVAQNFTRGETSTSVMCKVSGTDVFPVDIGMNGAPWGDTGSKLIPNVLADRKVAGGSRDIAVEAAMSEAECLKAIAYGIDIVYELKNMGYDIIATGEMGIGNTTPASAMAAVLLGVPAREMTGHGAGLSDAGFGHKISVVEKAVDRFYENYPQYSPDGGPESLSEDENRDEYTAGEEKNDGDISSRARKAAFMTLCELGGFDIAGLVGLFAGGSLYHVPMIIDGSVSSAAALTATCLDENITGYLIASHVSSEPAGGALLKALGLRAPLNCGMHLGEGSGAIAFLPMLDMAGRVYTDMKTFDDTDIKAYEDYGTGKERRR